MRIEWVLSSVCVCVYVDGFQQAAPQKTASQGYCAKRALVTHTHSKYRLVQMSGVEYNHWNYNRNRHQSNHWWQNAFDQIYGINSKRVII